MSSPKATKNLLSNTNPSELKNPPQQQPTQTLCLGRRRSGWTNFWHVKATKKSKFLKPRKSSPPQTRWILNLLRIFPQSSAIRITPYRRMEFHWLMSSGRIILWLRMRDVLDLLRLKNRPQKIGVKEWGLSRMNVASFPKNLSILWALPVSNFQAIHPYSS